MQYSHIGDFVMNDMSYLGDKMFLSQSINARKSWNGGGSLNLRLHDIWGFGANVSLGLYHYETMGEKWCHQLTTLNADFTIWWNKGPYTITYWRKVPGKYLGGNTVSKMENGDAPLVLNTIPTSIGPSGHHGCICLTARGLSIPHGAIQA